MIYTTGGLGYGQEAVWAKVKELLKVLNTNDVIERRNRYLNPKLSDSPYLLRGAAMPQTLLECDTLNVWVMDLKLSPNG